MPCINKLFNIFVWFAAHMFRVFEGKYDGDLGIKALRYSIIYDYH